ncbi:hypothetical protein ANRL1_03046 [Anaerolineae bacterium]|nr:hypothetical protein ANRL1_03046 [Anaerolineae bacterium]
MSLFSHILILIKGAGDLGTGVAWRLHKAGFAVVIVELAQPLVVRRTVAFANAVYDGAITVEGVVARCVDSFGQARALLDAGIIPVLVDPDGRAAKELLPRVLVDAVMAKHNTGTRLDQAEFIIALGPGFTPGVDCHAVIETSRGHNLGRVWWHRASEPNTGVPGEIGGKSGDRVLRAPRAGVMIGVAQIGDRVARGQVIARVDDAAVIAPFDGMLRGLVHDGLIVQAGMKIGDIDPRANRDACFTISDKSLAIGGGAVEAVLTWMNEKQNLELRVQSSD